MTLTTRLLFIDGRDGGQVDWALGVEGKTKIVLTGDPVLALMRQHKRRFFYDQKGLLTGRFGIGAVPATVAREGRRLRVREFPLSEGGTL